MALCTNTRGIMVVYMQGHAGFLSSTVGPLQFGIRRPRLASKSRERVKAAECMCWLQPQVYMFDLQPQVYMFDCRALSVSKKNSRSF